MAEDDAAAIDVLISSRPEYFAFARTVERGVNEIGLRAAVRSDPVEPLPAFSLLMGLLGPQGLSRAHDEERSVARRAEASVFRVLLPGARFSVPRDAGVVDLRRDVDEERAAQRVVAVANMAMGSSKRPLSPSVGSVALRSDPVSAAAVVRELFKLHPEYAGRTGAAVQVPERPRDARKPARVWLDEVGSLFEASKAPELHGRLVILGLALLVPSVRKLQPSDAIDALIVEFKPPPETILTQRGRSRWKALGRPSRVSPREGPAQERREESVPVHTDNAATVDALQRDGFALTLATRIRAMRGQEERAARAAGKEKGDAFLVHLDGPWGSGKTSILNFLAAHLGKRAKDPPDGELGPWVAITFNAWRHQRIVPPWWWLMITVAREGGRSLRKVDKLRWLSFRLREALWRASPAWPWILLAAALGITALLVWTSGLPELGETTERNVTIVATALTAVIALGGVLRGAMKAVATRSARGARAYLEQARDPMQAARKHFAELIDWLHYPVVIFVDDLDRCKGSNVVELLEGIQTLLREVPVTYVVAADRDWLSESYATEYEAFSSLGNEPGRPFGFRFLEKTFQISAPVPDVSPTTLRSFWDLLIQPADRDSRKALEHEREQARHDFEGLGAVEATRKLKEEPGADPVVRQARAEAVAMKHASPEAQEETEHALQPFAGLLDPNPRALKRLVNAFGVTRDIEILAGRNLECDEDEQQLTALWTVLELRWPELARHLARNPSHVEYVGTRPVPFEVPRGLRTLFTDDEVKRVVAGDAEGIDVGLDPEAIERCTGQKSPAARVS